MSCVVAVDVGSTRARAGVFDAKGRRLARAERPFATNRPAPDHAEHDFGDIWRAVCEAVREAVASSGRRPEDVRGIAFDATCSLALFDQAGEQVTVSTSGDDRWNVIMWADHRAIAEAQEITATRHRAVDYVGGVVSPEMQLPKLLWLERHLPRSWARMGLALDLGDALTWRASGKVAVSACTITCKWTYLNHEEEGWQADLFAKVGLQDLPERAGLPRRPEAIGARAGMLSDKAAAELGLTTDCAVGVGLIDAHAGGLGLLGAVPVHELDSRIAVISGTSTCHMAATREARPVPGVWGPYFEAMMPGLWLNEGGQSATGALLDHVLDWHAEGSALGADRHRRVLARIAELAREEGPSLDRGLLVLPDFHGNRSPLADPTLKGVIHGLTLDASFDGLARLYYAASVGIVLGTRHIFDELDKAGYGIRTLHLTGGHAESPVLVQLYADATQCEVVLPEEGDSVLLGTAIAAAAASGVHASLASAAAAMIGKGRTVSPDPAHRAHFERQYRKFRLMIEQRRALNAIE